jgi:hypothetical protein
MDTRIYELAKQAGYKVKTLYTGDDNYQTEHYMKDDVLEKFAELIVQECISEALSMRYAGNVAVADRLEKHFGVK